MTVIKHELNKNYENIKDFLLNIKDYFKNNSNTIHKARNELKVIEYKGIETVVKAFKVPNILNQIVYAYFRDSKAKKSYQNAIKLKNLNINTPKPIGYIEFYRNFLFKESFFISEKLDYLFTIREPLRNNNLKDREEIIKKFKLANFANDYQNLQTSVSIGLAALDKFKCGFTQNSNTISPLYLRKSQAERALEGEK